MVALLAREIAACRLRRPQGVRGRANGGGGFLLEAGSSLGNNRLDAQTHPTHRLLSLSVSFFDSKVGQR